MNDILVIDRAKKGQGMKNLVEEEKLSLPDLNRKDIFLLIHNGCQRFHAKISLLENVLACPVITVAVWCGSWAWQSLRLPD